MSFTLQRRNATTPIASLPSHYQDSNNNQSPQNNSSTLPIQTTQTVKTTNHGTIYTNVSLVPYVQQQQVSVMAIGPRIGYTPVMVSSYGSPIMMPTQGIPVMVSSYGGVQNVIVLQNKNQVDPLSRLAPHLVKF